MYPAQLRKQATLLLAGTRTAAGLECEETGRSTTKNRTMETW
jgi:hypothetical protein